MISLSNILEVWLAQKKRIGGKKFEVDDDDFDMIVCKSCRCFSAFIEADHLALRLDCPNYNIIRAVDPEFLSKLEAHLKAHVCG
jgi:hypothetical protein